MAYGATGAVRTAIHLAEVRRNLACSNSRMPCGGQERLSLCEPLYTQGVPVGRIAAKVHSRKNAKEDICLCNPLFIIDCRRNLHMCRKVSCCCQSRFRAYLMARMDPAADVGTLIEKHFPAKQKHLLKQRFIDCRLDKASCAIPREDEIVFGHHP
eukprot:3755638-Amphidinium_carterae.1